MPTFEIQTPDGRTFEVDGPDQNGAVAALQQHLSASGGAQQPPKQQPYTGMLLPFSRDETGVHLAVPRALSGAWDTLKGSVTLPGDVYQGKVDPFSDEAIGRSLDLATTISPASPASRGAPALMGGREKVDPPSAEALKAASEEAYKKARGLGVDYSSKAVADLASGVKSSLDQEGVLSALAPQTHSVLDALANPPQGSVAPFSSLEAARQTLNRIVSGPDAQERFAARRVIDGLDRLTSGADPQAVVAGPAAAAADLIKEARGNYAAAKRSDLLTGREEFAALRAAAANSGANYDNAMRSRLVDILKGEVTGEGRNLAAGFSDPEKALIESVARGNVLRNQTRNVANLLGGGGGLGNFITAGAGAGAGAAMGGPMGAAVGAVAGAVPGRVAKAAQNYMARKAFENLDETVRMRSPLYEALVQGAPMKAGNADLRSGIVKYLLELEAADKARKSAQMQAPEA